jgi:hypothetical protein
MMLTNKPLGRRTVLRGLGATLALPLLDSMVPALAFSAQAKQLAKSPVRLGYVYTPNGIIGCSDKSPRPCAPIRSPRRRARAAPATRPVPAPWRI